MTDNFPQIRHAMLKDALLHLQKALDLLDLAYAPGHIGAHVDLALHELEDVLPVMASLDGIRTAGNSAGIAPGA